MAEDPAVLIEERVPVRAEECKTVWGVKPGKGTRGARVVAVLIAIPGSNKCRFGRCVDGLAPGICCLGIPVLAKALVPLDLKAVVITPCGVARQDVRCVTRIGTARISARHKSTVLESSDRDGRCRAKRI